MEEVIPFASLSCLQPLNVLLVEPHLNSPISTENESNGIPDPDVVRSTYFQLTYEWPLFHNLYGRNNYNISAVILEEGAQATTADHSHYWPENATDNQGDKFTTYWSTVGACSTFLQASLIRAAFLRTACARAASAPSTSATTPSTPAPALSQADCNEKSNQYCKPQFVHQFNGCNDENKVPVTISIIIICENLMPDVLLTPILSQLFPR